MVWICIEYIFNWSQSVFKQYHTISCIVWEAYNNVFFFTLSGFCAIFSDTFYPMCVVKPTKHCHYFCYQFSSVQLLSRVQLFATPWITARQASLSITNSRNSPRLTSIESVMPSSHLILCRPLLLLPPIPPSIRVFQWVNFSHEVAKVLDFQL